MVLFRCSIDLLEDTNMGDENCMEITEELNKGRGFCFVSSRRHREGIMITGAAQTRQEMDKVIQSFIDRTDFQVAGRSFSEITLEQFLHDLRCCNDTYVRNVNEIKEEYGFIEADWVCHWGFRLSESLFKSSDRKKILKDSSEAFINDSLKNEIERILSHRSGKKILGHPVHYLIHKHGEEECRKASVCLMQALYEQNRIGQKRYFVIDIDEETELDEDNLRALYKGSADGAVLIRYKALEGLFPKVLFDGIVSVAREYKNSVLTILCVQSGHKEQLKGIWDTMSELGVVEISDVELSRDEATEYVRGLCRKNKVRANKSLLRVFEEDRQYFSDEVDKAFDTWYQNRLLNDQYPEYSEIVLLNNDEEYLNDCLEDPIESDKEDAYSELMEMTGLDEAKKVITQAVNYFKVQKLLKDKGFSSDKPTMHMVFAGDPGTAKTTVARLFSRIMAENGILSKGHLVEVGRADLVAKYVGHTAKAVQAKFEEAKGGVLFCDEIYSLVDDRRGSFGDEAINTIVQEMENHREDVIVILAGYPDRMEQFINTNPGLKSRIAFHVQFANYSVEDLLNISEYIADEKGMKISEPAKKKLQRIYESVYRTRDYGNGRYVRNCLEQARMKMATRLLRMNFEEITEEVCSTILEEDVELPKSVAREEKSFIGFVA